MTKVNPGQHEGPPPAYGPPLSSADPAYPPQYQPPPPQGYQPPPPPPGQGYQQPYQHNYGQTTVVVQQPGMGPPLGSTTRYFSVPALVVCQHCRATVTTSTSFSVGTYAWLIAGIILFFGCWLGCCLIPFCVDSCKDVIHTCPNCRGVVGRYTRL